MAADDLQFSNLRWLVDQIKATGVKSVARDPSLVRAPGVWVRFDGIENGALAGTAIRATLHLVVGVGADLDREEAALEALFNQVKPVWQTVGGPTGTILPIGLRLQASDAPMPCLTVPIKLRTKKEPTP